MTLRAMCTWMAAAALGMTAPACGDDSGDDDGNGRGADAGEGPGDSTDEIEVAGTWDSEFGEVTIDGETWDDGFALAIVSFDNDDNFVITQTPDDAEFDPGTFGKTIWTEPNDDGFFFCTVDFGLDTAADAENSSMMADDSDPAESGCGMMDRPWTEVTPQ